MFVCLCVCVRVYVCARICVFVCECVGVRVSDLKCKYQMQNASSFVGGSQALLLLCRWDK